MSVVSCSESVPVASNMYKAGRAQNCHVALEMLLQAGYANPKKPGKNRAFVGQHCLHAKLTR